MPVGTTGTACQPRLTPDRHESHEPRNKRDLALWGVGVDSESVESTQPHPAQPHQTVRIRHTFLDAHSLPSLLHFPCAVTDSHSESHVASFIPFFGIGYG